MSPRVLGTPERIAEVRRLRAARVPVRSIATGLGVSFKTIYAWLEDPDGTKRAARQAGYAGRCLDCGSPTDGSNGRAKAPERCGPCRHEFEYGARDRLIVDMWNEGMPAPRIGEAMGMPETQVRGIVQNLRRRSDVDVARRALPSAREVREERDRAFVGMWNTGASKAEIATKLGYASVETVTTVATRLRADGHHLRSRVARRLTIEQVREIRAAARERRSLRALAKRYGVAPNAIYQVVHGTTHRDVV